MKVVLKQDVKNIGKKDGLYEVSDGYARNYLFPRGLAVEADTAAMNEVRSKAEARQHKQEMEKAAAEEQAAKLKDKVVTVHAKAGQGGRLFGAVTVKDIAAALSKEGIDIDKRKLSIDGREIKQFGTYEVEAKIAAGITAKFSCKVEE